MGAPNYVEWAIWVLLRDQCPALWLGFPIGAGDVYWVDGINGLDTNIGTRPDQPFQTIEHAIDQCTADHNDYIMVLDCWQQDTFPIAVDVSRIHILGLPGSFGGYNGMLPKMAPAAADDNPVFNVTANYCEIAHFELGGGDTAPCILITGADGTYIHDCYFGAFPDLLGGSTPLDGIRFSAQSALETLIKNCKFYGNGGNVRGGITQDGIRGMLFGGLEVLTGSQIEENEFLGLPGCGVNLTFADSMAIKKNLFALDADTQGAAITLSATCQGNLIAENKAQFGHDAMAANPYLDQASTPATPDMNHWTYNWAGNLVVYPD